MEILCRIRDINRLTAAFEENLKAMYGLCLNEGMLLCTLQNDNYYSSGEIAEILGLTTSNASKVIKSVESKGLIERSLGKDDKRQMYFSLTTNGKAKIAALKCDSFEISDELRKYLTT